MSASAVSRTSERARKSPARLRRVERLDIATILLVIAASSSFYVFGLARYSDDWAFFEMLSRAPDQSITGLYGRLSSEPHLAVRPGQILWYIALRKLSADSVQWAHLANHLVFAIGSIALYAALRSIPATRAAAFPVVVIYACMPNFSAAKLWYANHQATLSFLFFALTLLAVARLRTAVPRWRPWLLAVLPLTTAASNLCYELFGFILLAPAFVWVGWGSPLRELSRDRLFIQASVVIGLAFAATSLFKLSHGYGVDLPDGPQAIAPQLKLAAVLYANAAYTNFWTLGAGIPLTVIRIIGGRHFAPVAIPAALLAAAILVAREAVARHCAARGEPRAAAAPVGFLAVSGLIAFGLGYVPFLINFFFDPWPFGEANRVNIGAALGAALLFYAGSQWLARRQPRLARAVVIVFCASGVLLQVAVGRMWVRSAQIQQRFIATMLADVGPVKEGETLLVYGLCPYYGAGPVLNSAADHGARVRLATGLRTVHADAVLPNSRIEGDRIVTDFYGWLHSYPYRALLVYDARERAVTRIDSAAQARAFFAVHRLSNAAGCDYRLGRGTPLD